MVPSLEEKIQSSGNPARMLRSNPAVHYPFWYPPEWTTWANEQTAWKDSCVLFDQSHHMTEVTFKGPDVKRLLSDTGEPDGGAGRPFMEPHHVQTTIRATIHTRRPRQD